MAPGGTFFTRFQINNPNSYVIIVNLDVRYRSSTGAEGDFEPAAYPMVVKPGTAWYVRPCPVSSSLAAGNYAVACYLLNTDGSTVAQTSYLEKKLAVTSLITGNYKWRYQTGGAVTSSPALVGDSAIYMGSSDYYLYALGTDGTLKWRYQTGNYVYSSPAIGRDGTVYVGSDGIYAIKPDGKPKWIYQTGYVRSSPALGEDGTVYLGSDDYYIYALTEDGTLKWRYRTGSVVRSSPAVSSDGTVYVGSNDKYLYALNPDSTLKWKYLTGGSVNSSPAIGAGGTVYVGSDDYYIYAFKPDGTLKWRYQTGSSVSSSPAVGSDGTIYVGSNDYYFYALNQDGTLKWRYKSNYYYYSPSPAIGSDSTIYFGSSSYLYALDSDGMLKWTFQTGSSVESSPAIGMDGTVYLGSDDNYFYALEAVTSEGLDSGPWPKWHHDLRNSGNARGISGSAPGDLNADYQVDLFDILTIVRIALGRISPTEDQRRAADLNADGKIDILDVISCVNRTLGRSLQLAASSPETLTLLDREQLKSDLVLLGADQELIGDVLMLLEQRPPMLPKAFSLGQNAPNPFNPATTISYDIPQGQAVQVSLKVYDLRGRLVRTLVDQEREPGAYSVVWNGRDGHGRQLASGVYLYRMQAGEFTQTRKMVLLK